MSRFQVKCCFWLGLFSIDQCAICSAQYLRVEPLRVAGVRPDGEHLWLTTPWMDYVPNTSPQPGRWEWAWDSFEAQSPNPNRGHPDFLGGCNWPGPGSRWFLGTAYNNPFTSRDIRECRPVASDGVFFAWFWTVGGVGTAERCLIAIMTFDEWHACDNPGSENLGGVVYDFGVLDSGIEFGTYYYAGVDLRSDGLTHQLPTDGTGGFQVRFAKMLNESTGEATQPTLCQSMLWSTSEYEWPQDGRIGSEQQYQFDDDDPSDGHFNLPRECYLYSFGICNESLGPCVGFVRYDSDRCGCMGEFDGDLVVDVDDLAQLLAQFGERTAGIEIPCIDIDENGHVDESDLAILLARFGTLCE